MKARTAHIDGELARSTTPDCRALLRPRPRPTASERRTRLVYYAFDLLHLDRRDVSRLPLIERKALLEPLAANKSGLQFNGHEAGDGELILKHAGKLGFEGVVSKTIDAPYAPGKSRPLAQSGAAARSAAIWGGLAAQGAAADRQGPRQAFPCRRGQHR